jgi:hypothetical protein
MLRRVFVKRLDFANMIHQQLDKSKLVFFDQIDPINGFNQLAATANTLNFLYTFAQQNSNQQ